MSNQYKIKPSAIMVHIIFFYKKYTENLIEFKSLIYSADIKLIKIITGNSKLPHIKYFIGKGKAEEIADIVKNNNINMIIFNHNLNPTQERNLEQLCKCRVIDRTGLILSIFAKRVNTYEGKLQVKLAQLNYTSTRLVHTWTHLERQKGGVGLRGPGETQLEIDRRLIQNKIKYIYIRLNKLKKQRQQNQINRNKAGIPTISLVGYTNVGKSTLFNYMTLSKACTTNKLFTTLDTTLRRIKINNIGNIILSDTIGFIHNLSYKLINAFKATLQEIQNSNLLLHIIDITDNYMEKHIQVVNNILQEIKANKIPVLLVMNKIDIFNKCICCIDRDQQHTPIRVWISSRTGEGIPLLLQALSELLCGKMVYYRLCLPPKAGGLRSKLYQLKAIIYEKNDQNGNIIVKIQLPIIIWKKFCIKEKKIINYII